MLTSPLYAFLSDGVQKADTGGLYGESAAREMAGLRKRGNLPMEARKRIALVAHDNKKQDISEWAKYNRALLVEHELWATGTTGQLLERVLEVPVGRFQSGPLGGDQQVGAKIAGGEIDCLIFFWDPLESLPHDPDVKALLRIAGVWNIPVATNRASADFLISSPLMSQAYQQLLPDYADYLSRPIRAKTARR